MRLPFSNSAITRFISPFRPVFAFIGAILIILGVPVALLTPFPFVPIGLPVVILGVVLLARNSLRGRTWLQSVLAKHPKLRRYAPHWLLDLIFGKE